MLEQELSRNIKQYYSEDNALTYHFWSWLQPNMSCCGVAGTNAYKIWASSNILVDNHKVPESCCKLADCMYEPNAETAFLTGCAYKILLYVQVFVPPWRD